MLKKLDLRLVVSNHGIDEYRECIKRFQHCRNIEELKLDFGYDLRGFDTRPVHGFPKELLRNFFGENGYKLKVLHLRHAHIDISFVMKYCIIVQEN